MSNTVTLANKYRPKVFDEIVEQDSIKTILKNQLSTNNLKHAYLFCGSAGTGKTTSARIIADYMNGGKATPIELDCASHNGVDDVRTIIEECKTNPMVGRYKIFILDEVHMLTQQAWNAMLKILEEPPEYVIFIFCTTDPQKILGTILSRVQRFNFSRISNAGIVGRLKYIIDSENILRKDSGLDLITVEPSSLEYIARLSKGGMRDSITTLEKCIDYNLNLTQENVSIATSGGVTETMMLKLFGHIFSYRCKDALLLFNDIYMSGIDVSLFIKLFSEYLQDCVKYIITLNPDITKLSDITINKLDKVVDSLKDVQDLAMDFMTYLGDRFSTDDLKILVESWIIKACKIK